MEQRVIAILSAQGHVTPDARTREMENLRKLGDEALYQQVFPLADDDMRVLCEALPRFIESPGADPNIKYAEDLALIRAWRDVAPDAGSQRDAPPAIPGSPRS